MAGNNVRRSCLLLLLPRDPKTHDSSADAPRARRSPSLLFTTEKHKTTPARLRVQIAANRFFLSSSSTQFPQLIGKRKTNGSAFR